MGRPAMTAPAGATGTISLLHFDRPYRHARHYLGWTDDLETRLAAHSRGQGARLLAVIRAHGIGWTLARTWTGTRSRERALKNQGGASRRCPGCGVTPRTGQVMLPRNADGSLSRLRTTDAQKHAAGVMTSAQQAEHTALRPRPGENRAGKARALLIDLSPWEVA